MYATRTWRFHLSTKQAVIVRNRRQRGNEGLGEEALEDYSDLVNEIIGLKGGSWPDRFLPLGGRPGG